MPQSFEAKRGLSPIGTRKTSHLMPLEPRMMFDGAAVATAAEVVMPEPLLQDAIDLTAHDLSGFDAAGDLAAYAVPVSSDVIFIDSAVADYQSLVGEWQGRGDIVIIDSTRDGIDQMMEALAG